MSKYRSVKTVVDGIKFASKREAARYTELKLLESLPELHVDKIRNLELQHKFPLHVDGIKIGHYIADFVYFENEKRVVEDCKGFRTPLYRWKKKHTEAEYKVQIRET